MSRKGSTSEAGTCGSHDALSASALFPTNGPLHPRQLIGGDDEVQALVEGLAQGEHQVLTGSPKTGKTSVARAAVGALEAKGWCSVTVELSRMTGVDDLIDGIALEGAGQSDGLTEALKSLQGAASVENDRLVLLLDDIEEIASTQLFGKAEDVAAAIQSGLEKAPRVSCVLVGGVHYLMRQLFRSEQGAFHGFGSLTDLPPISPDAWRAGLHARFTNGGCEVRPALIDRILELGEGHPRTTMLIARETYVRATATHGRAVDSAQADEGLEAALAADRTAHESECARVRTLGKHTFPTALRVAMGDSAYKHLPPAIARQTLRNLEIAGVVERPRSREWRMVNPLFHRYMLGMKDGTSQQAEQDAVSTTVRAQPPAALLGAESEVSDETPVVSPDAIELDPARLSLRHPRREEAPAIAEVVAATVTSSSNGAADGSGRADLGSGQRLGSYVSRAISRAPDRYWQLEEDGRPIGGLVVYRPRASLGRMATAGVDPLAQLALLCAVAVLALCGIGLLLVRQAWEWGGVGGLLFGCFLGCLLLVALLTTPVLGRARASGIARRRGGAVFEGMWSAPGAMPALFGALATELPDTLLTAYVEKPDLMAAYRDLGFRPRAGRVLAGVLDPQGDLPARSATSRVASSRRARSENAERPASDIGV